MDTIAKNQIHIAEITGYSSTGAGVCRVLGRAVFVERALVGEVWEILIIKVSASSVFGKGIKLLSPSGARREPECPVFNKCGGCSLLHMSYEEELSFKLGRVNDALERIGGLSFRIPEIVPAGDGAQYHYRNKAVFNIAAGKDGKARAGFFRPRSHDLVSVDSCLIQPELFTRAANTLCAFMDETRVLPYDEGTGKGAVRHLLLRRSSMRGNALAVIVSARGFGESTQELVSALRLACPELTGIVLCINKSEGNVILSGQFRTLWGCGHIEEQLCGLGFRISPESFFQINPPQAEKLFSLVCDYAGPGIDVALDLYCGAGAIALCLARRAKKVIGAEVVESAVINARENAAINAITNAEFILGDASAAASELSSRGIRPDTIVVDPPRKGLTPGLIETIAQMSPERVVYVSCDPGTLARDLALFSGKSYTVKDAVAVDMFPRTAHVECVVQLSRA